MAALKLVPADADASTTLSAPVRVGKDVLGLLSAAMYTEPLAIVREYVQNSADSIDVAYDSGVLSPRKPGRIDIVADAQDRSLTIRDNGLGIERAHAEEVLVAFGLSSKRGTEARGFRGIGRLGGLGFAQRVVFRTRFVGEETISEIAWDCRSLRAILLDAGERSDLAEVVRRVVSVRSIEDRAAPEHFFEVQLQSVGRVRSDRLLDATALTGYLEQVAPLPLSPTLRFAEEISTYVGEFVSRRRIDVTVNGSEPLYRPHRTGFAVTGNKTDRFSEVELLKYMGLNGGLAAIGWILHHGYRGALKSSEAIRGLRARVGDIQIGDETLFTRIFPESRFNGWIVGELHIVDRGIIPNGRRDDFEATAAHAHFLNQLVPLGRELGRRCRASSMERARFQAFLRHEATVLELARQIRNRRLTGKRQKAALREAFAALEAMKKLLPHCSTKKAVLADLSSSLRGCQSVLGKSKEAGRTEDPLASIPRGKRATVEEVLGAVQVCMSNKRAAELLVDRITKRLVRQYTD